MAAFFSLLLTSFSFNIRIYFSHFCQTPHCDHKDKKKCKKCPLWTGGGAADDEKKVREAALAEAAKVEEETKKEAAKQQSQAASAATAPFASFAQKKHALKPADGVQIDVESILRAPSKTR